MEINYKASPTGAKFHASQKVCRGFLGPVGNGKSVTCIMEGLRLSQDQWPNSEGVRKSRGIIVRNTSLELRTTTLKTWKQWIPERIAPVVMSPIITTTLKQSLSDGTKMEMEIIFLAMDKDDDVKKVLSLETTWMFLNEAKQLPYSVVKAARERIGRYPAEVDGYTDTDNYKAPRWTQAELDAEESMIDEVKRDLLGTYHPCKRKALMMDTNPPEDDHWWYQLAEEGCLRRSKNKEVAKERTAQIFDFFRGPAPLIEEDGKYRPSPAAENIRYLPGGFQYYLDMIAGNPEDHINVMVMGNYGIIKEGRPVYPSYNDRIHCPERGVKAIKGLDLCLGWDFGLTPSVIFGQLTPRGQVRIVAELVSEDIDVRTFARDVVKPFIQKYFKDFEIGFSFGDPAGNNRGEGEGKASIGILNDLYADESDDENYKGDIPLNMGFYTEEAPTNDPTLRIDAVTSFLNKMVDGEPGYQLNKACESLRKGKAGGYCYKRVAIAGSEERFRDKPDKNKYSHPSDAEQYLCLGFAGGYVTDDSEDEDEEDQDYYGETNAMGY